MMQIFKLFFLLVVFHSTAQSTDAPSTEDPPKLKIIIEAPISHQDKNANDPVSLELSKCYLLTPIGKSPSNSLEPDELAEVYVLTPQEIEKLAVLAGTDRLMNEVPAQPKTVTQRRRSCWESLYCLCCRKPNDGSHSR